MDYLQDKIRVGLANPTIKAHLAECDAFVSEVFGPEWGAFGYAPWAQELGVPFVPRDDGEPEVKVVEEELATAVEGVRTRARGKGKSTGKLEQAAETMRPVPRIKLKVTKPSPDAKTSRKVESEDVGSSDSAEELVRHDLTHNACETQPLQKEYKTPCKRCVESGAECLYQTDVRCALCASRGRKCERPDRESLILRVVSVLKSYSYCVDSSA